MTKQLNPEARAELAIRLIERASYKIPQFAQLLREKTGWTDELKEQRAMQVVFHLLECFDEYAPDEDWMREVYLLSGEAMVETDEGWVPYDQAPADRREWIDVVNEPKGAAEGGSGPTSGPPFEAAAAAVAEPGGDS